MRNLIPLCFIILTSVSSWSSPKTIFEEGFKWQKKQIEVCWANLDEYRKVDPWLGDKIAKVKFNYIDSSTRQKVREKVQSQYTLKRTGIEFIGWGMCDDAPNADIVILALDQLPIRYSGLATVGTRDDHNLKMVRTGKGTMFLNRTQDNLMMDKDEELLVSALHEFGHVAGLRHEQWRLAAQKDPNCKEKFGGKLPLITESDDTSASQYIGTYDPESIMNYCYIWTMGTTLGGGDLIKLSVKDRIALLCMYDPERLDPKYCEKHSLIEEIKNKK